MVAKGHIERVVRISVAVRSFLRARCLYRLLLVCVACSGGSKGTGTQVTICTDLKCIDEFSAAIAVATDTLPSGIQTLSVAADDVQLSCTFMFPPGSASNAGAQCSGSLSIVVQAAATCSAVSTDGAIEEKCVATPGQYNEILILEGTPSSIQIQQSTGGTVVLNESVSPQYRANQPNGPGCLPICEQAAVQWSIPTERD